MCKPSFEVKSGETELLWPCMQLPVAYSRKALQLCMDIAEPESSESPYTEDPAADADVRTGGTSMLTDAAAFRLGKIVSARVLPFLHLLFMWRLPGSSSTTASQMSTDQQQVWQSRTCR